MSNSYNGFSTKQSKTSGARSGEFTVDIEFPDRKSQTVKTPAVLLSTPGGRLPILTNDLVEDLQESLDDTQPLCGFSSIGDILMYTKGLKRPLSQFMNAKQNCVLHLLTGTKSTNILPSQQGSVKMSKKSKKGDSETVAGCIVPTLTGNREVDLSTYGDVAKLAGHSLIIPPMDDSSAHDTYKRTKLSMERSDAALKGMLETCEPGRQLCAPLVGGTCRALREASANTTSAAAAKIPNCIAAFVIGDVSQGETHSTSDAPSSDSETQNTGEVGDQSVRDSPYAVGFLDRTGMIQTSLSNCDEKYMRIVLGGPATPLELLELISLGVDCVETTYPLVLSTLGYASCYWLGEDVQPQSTSQNLESKLNLRSAIYETDNAPLCRGCKCFACRNHTRAYIHHLLNVHEMLADILLYVHNVFHLRKLFAVVRIKIEAGEMQQFTQKFKSLHYGWDSKKLATKSQSGDN